MVHAKTVTTNQIRFIAALGAMLSAAAVGSKGD
jgi:hypothetical protein